MSAKITTSFSDHAHSHAPNRFAVIPTPLRLDAVPDYTGKGVTIAFLDSGFYPHPDLTQPVNRIIAYEDITRPDAALKADAAPEESDWHGTMTATAAAGNGYLSRGDFRGIAANAQVVLIKVSEQGRISEDNIARGIHRVIALKDRYDIRLLSISLGGNQDLPRGENIVNQAAEEAVAAGITVIAAAGNSGCSDHHRTLPPASSPSVIAVGGYDDHNRFRAEEHALYCSSFGVTADGLIKPEIIAPAMWVAAPVLPHTAAWRQAVALDRLISAPDYLLNELAQELWRAAGLSASLHAEAPETIRATVESLLRQNKFISSHYQHVDGTSFAAPVVASVVAQMIEARPELTPAAIRHILISTADRIQSHPLIRQGYGMLNARRAVAHALREQHISGIDLIGPPRIEGNTIVFTHHDDDAQSVALAGDFNQWHASRNIFTRQTDGTWRAVISLPPPGRRRYKFVINGERWIDDPGNGMKEADGYGGFNSIVNIV